jgi:hypothetical protein
VVRKGGHVFRNDLTEFVGLGMLLYVRDSISCNFRYVCDRFRIFKNTYVFILPGGIDSRFFVTDMLDRGGQETIHFRIRVRIVNVAMLPQILARYELTPSIRPPVAQKP